jgi:hypothetical protein
MVTFYLFCHKLSHRDDPVGDFAQDFLRDFKGPDVATWNELEAYLRWRGACSEAVEAGREAWREYEQRQPTMQFTRRI